MGGRIKESNNEITGYITLESRTTLNIEWKSSSSKLIVQPSSEKPGYDFKIQLNKDETMTYELLALNINDKTRVIYIIYLPEFIKSSIKEDDIYIPLSSKRKKHFHL